MVLKIQGNKMPQDETELTREELLKLADTFGVTNTELAALIKNIRNNSKDFEKEIKRLNDQVKKGRAGYADQLALIDRLNDEIEKLGNSTADQAKKSKLLSDRKELVEKAAVKNFQEQRQKFGEELGKAAITGTGKFVRGLQDGVSATQLTNTVLNASIDVAAAGAMGLGKTLTAVAPAMAALGPYGVIAGVAATAVGYLAQTAGEAGGALAKFAVEILSKEVEKTIKAFGSISAAGALFADGMTGVRLAARDARLPLEAFAAVISRQSATLAAAGLSVPLAVKKLGGALAAGGDGMRLKFQNLGFRIEEHGDLVAETMALMSQSGGPLRASNEEVAAETEKYAENLRIISAITGEDGKKKMAAVQEQANQLAFQQKLAKMEPETRKAALEAMALMDSLQRKNFMELVNFGAVISADGAAAAALSSGLRDSTAEALGAFKSGNLNAQTMADIGIRHNQQMQKDYLAAEAIGLVGAAKVGGLGQELAEVFGIAVQELQKMTPEAIAEAKRLAKLQGETVDPMTKQLNSAAIAATKLAMAMEIKLLPYMEDFARYSEKILAGFVSYLGGLGGEKKFGDTGAETPTSVLQPAFGSIMREMPRIQDYQTQPGSSTTRGVKEIGKALGGISTGPVSGYSETLHGTEAVVPLSDNRSIPVSLDSSSITAAVNQQSGILAEILRAMQNNNSLTSQLAMNTV